MNKVIQIMHIVYVLFTSIKNAIESLVLDKPDNNKLKGDKE